MYNSKSGKLVNELSKSASELDENAITRLRTEYKLLREILEIQEE